MEIPESSFCHFSPPPADSLARAPAVSRGFVDDGLMLLRMPEQPKSLPDDLVESPLPNGGVLHEKFYMRNQPC